jgi:2-keto-4-pentenoate hydratase
MRNGWREPAAAADFAKVSGPGLIAAELLQAACIIGTEVKDWQTIDFALRGRSMFQDKEIGGGPGTNVMGGALISLAWLANKLI